MKKILIVNDVPSVNKLLAHNFESNGFCVGTALTGTEGIALAKKNKYDIILLDYKLPDIDGGEVCKEIRSDTASHRPLIYFISALDRNALEKVIADTGAEGYLDITSDVEELVKKIKKLLGD